MAMKSLLPWTRRNGGEVSRFEDNPFMSLHREMNRVFDEFFKRFEAEPFAGLAPTGPRADVAETDDSVEVTVELPGLDEKDVEVSVTEDALTIKGEKKSEREEKKKGYYLSERSYGSFFRTIPLPPGVDGEKAVAEFKKGVLNVSIPKTAEAKQKVKKIEVKGA